MPINIKRTSSGEKEQTKFGLQRRPSHEPVEKARGTPSDPVGMKSPSYEMARGKSGSEMVTNNGTGSTAEVAKSIRRGSEPVPARSILQLIFDAERNTLAFEYETNTSGMHVPIHPHSHFSKIFQFFSGVLVIYSVIVNSFVFVFLSDKQGWCQNSPTQEFDMFVDLLFMIEIVVFFLTGYFKEARYISEWRPVALAYTKKSFFIDLAAAFPISWIEYWLAPNEPCDVQSIQQENADRFQSLRLLRMIRLLRLMKVLKLFDTLRELFNVHAHVVRLQKLVFTVCLIAHLGACCWWYIKVNFTDPEELRAFRIQHGVKVDETFWEYVWSDYILSVYFQMTTLCTVGYGDIYAVSDSERVLMCGIMLIGATCFASIISDIGSLIQTMRAEINECKEVCEEVFHFLQHRGCHHLQSNVDDYFRFKKEHTLLSDFDLSDMPIALRNEARFEIMHNLFRSVTVLSTNDPEISNAILYYVISNLEVQIRIPGEEIYAVGDEPEAVHIIFNGHVHIFLPETDVHGIRCARHQPVEVYGPSDMFGEMEPLVRSRRCFRAVSIAFVELGSVYIPEWEQLLSLFESVRTAVEESVTANVRKISGLVRYDPSSCQWELRTCDTPSERWLFLANYMWHRNYVEHRQSNSGSPTLHNIVKSFQKKLRSTWTAPCPFWYTLMDAIRHLQGSVVRQQLQESVSSPYTHFCFPYDSNPGYLPLQLYQHPPLLTQSVAHELQLDALVRTEKDAMKNLVKLSEDLTLEKVGDAFVVMQGLEQEIRTLSMLLTGEFSPDIETNKDNVTTEKCGIAISGSDDSILRAVHELLKKGEESKYLIEIVEERLVDLCTVSERLAKQMALQAYASKTTDSGY